MRTKKDRWIEKKEIGTIVAHEYHRPPVRQKKRKRDNYELKVEPNFDLIGAWVRDGLNDKQIAENLGISCTSLAEYRKKYPEFGEMFAVNRQKLDLVHMVNAYQRRAEGYTVVELEKEYKIVDGMRVLVKEKEKERHIPADPRALENWINLRMSADPLWGKLREVMHDRAVADGIEGGIVIIPERKKDGNDMGAATKTT